MCLCGVLCVRLCVLAGVCDLFLCGVSVCVWAVCVV